MKHVTIKLISVLCIGLLAACSSGDTKQSAQTVLFGELRDAIKAKRAARKSPPAPFKITRALLNQQTIGSLEVTVEKNQQTAYLIPGAYRDDNLPGKIEVWRTISNENVILRGGVLIATRGLGRDLASSDASAALRAIRARGAGGGERRMQVRNDVNGADEILLQCETSVVGDEAIDIIELRFSARHLKEVCQSSLGQVTNQYWVNRSGDVLQSRQWAGPGVGYLTIRLLKK